MVRSGSKVGSKYKFLIASTNDEFCPTLKTSANTQSGSNVGCVMEIVIIGLERKDIENAMKTAILALTKMKSNKDIVGISAGNYGGKLGQHHFKLRKILK